MTKKSSDDLLGLFSTRSSKKPATTIEQVKDETPKVEAQETKEVAASKPEEKKKTPERPKKASLSSVAQAVLRETRRELGSQEGASEQREVTEESITRAVDSVCARKGFSIDDLARADIIIHLKRDLLGWGVLQPLIDNEEVTDIHCYDYRTVVLQRGKESETTGIEWPNHEAYATFIDRILLRLGKSLSNQQHTVDASFPDGKRICAVHQSVCGARGPLMTIRIPRISEASLESIVSYQVAPPLIVNYLAAMTRTCEHTIMVAGETGTGKTTLLRCLGTQFRHDEAIIGVEDTPELNYQHPYYRSLVSRYANVEGIGEVTLQEHIKTTLRLCPTRVILGEMRTPQAAEAFIESTQTGHCGMSTIHARNARETLTRLENLLGRAQRGVSMDVIRQQLSLAIDIICWNMRERGTGRIRLAEVVEVGNYVEGQIQVRPMFKLVEMGEEPKWEVLSWSSNHERVLEENNIFLGDAPKFLSFSQAEDFSEGEKTA